MHYTGVWSPTGPPMKIEVDESDLDEIADIHSRMNNHTDEQIRDETVRYLESDSRKYRYAKDNPPPKPQLVWAEDDFLTQG